MSERLYDITELSTEQFVDIARSYDLGDVLETRLCSAGLINSNYEVTTSKGRYLIRIYAPLRERENIAFELSILQHLSAQGFPCQRPLRAQSGALIGTIGERSFGVLTFLPGRTLEQERLSEAICRQMGTIYPRMQRLLQGFVPEGSKPDADYPLIQGLVEDIRSVFRDKGVPEEQRSRFESLWSEISPPFRESERSVVHGDLYYANIICDGDQITGIIDFDDAFLGSPLLDLALVVMEFSTQKDNVIDFSLVSAFLEAYAEHALPIAVTPESLWNAARFQCFKFLGYTLELTVEAGDPPTKNEYFERLLYLSEPAVRDRFMGAVRGTLGTAG